MWVISRARLREFWFRHPDAERRLRAWYQIVDTADWSDWGELRQTFPSADSVGLLTVFNIGGNTYRLVARVEFEKRRVYVRRVITHAEYHANDWKHDP
ncbi:MAG: type II toxin-antitoxin system HigB family toxin [Chloroflexota bacterium]|nr:MAG: type II toxin-antitoxin system HigB family toxin [Chloroflexota bacterium]